MTDKYKFSAEWEKPTRIKEINIRLPMRHTLWKNKSGGNDNSYRVLFVTNRTNVHLDHPMQVVCENAFNHTKWSVDLSEWANTMEFERAERHLLTTSELQKLNQGYESYWRAQWII